jgi:hypothetical protein
MLFNGGEIIETVMYAQHAAVGGAFAVRREIIAAGAYATFAERRAQRLCSRAFLIASKSVTDQDDQFLRAFYAA